MHIPINERRGLQSWLDTLGGGSLEKTLRAEGEVGVISEIKPSEKERVEELAIAGVPFLPPPAITFNTFQEIAIAFDKCFCIERAQRKFSAISPNADPTLIEKAFRIAEQKLVLAMLEKWSESTAKMAEQAREYRREVALKTQEEQSRILREYIKAAAEKTPVAMQPAFAMLLGAIAADASLISTIQAIVPGLATAQVVLPPLLHVTVASELTLLAGGLLATTVSWATPIAISLARASPHESERQFGIDAAKAFALTLAGMLTSESVTRFMSTRMDQAVTNKLLSKDQAQTALATLNICLLASAMALLYKSEAGGVTGGELKGIMDGSISLSQDDFLLTLAKLVKEQLEKIPTRDREAILSQIFGSYDANPSLTTFLDPIKIFIALWDPRFLQTTNTSRRA